MSCGGSAGDVSLTTEAPENDPRHLLAHIAYQNQGRHARESERELIKHHKSDTGFKSQ